MTAPKSVWGVDIGQCALKAVKLREVDGQLLAEAFDVVEHHRILSEPEADREALIRQALEVFLSRNDTANCKLAVAVSGQSSFTKFVKMPPVDVKRIPDLVRFEAEQQIPFDINEVIWQWQSFPDPDSPDLEVGLFAIKQSDVYRILAPFSESLLDVDVVQMAPLALYNFMVHDHQIAEQGATLLIDIGADSTDLVVADGPRLWTRTVQLGGNNFTEALVKAFKLSFPKAEKLKVTAATSKYARQVFQAMRPVFADLVQEIQRSIGFYTSLHRQSRFARVLGLGNGFRLPGLQKFLEQNLNTPVVRIDGFNAVQLAPSISAPSFSEHVLGLGVAYGLAVQGLGLGSATANLLPGVIASHRRWFKKRPWFIAAAALVAAASLSVALRQWSDNRTLGADPAGELRQAREVVSKYQPLQREFDEAVSQLNGSDRPVQELLESQGYRSFWPHAVDVIGDAVAVAAPHQHLLTAQGAAELKTRVPDPAQRRLMVLESLKVDFLPNVSDPNALILDAMGGGFGMGGGPGMGEMEPGGMGRGMPGGGMFGAPGGPVAVAGGDSAGGKGFRFLLTFGTPLNESGAMAIPNAFLEALKRQSAEKYGQEIELVKGQYAGKVADPSTPGGMMYGGARPRGMMAEEMGGEFGPGARFGMTAGPVGTTATAADVGPTDVAGCPLSKYGHYRIVFILKVKGNGLTPFEGIGAETATGVPGM